MTAPRMVKSGRSLPLYISAFCPKKAPTPTVTAICVAMPIYFMMEALVLGLDFAGFFSCFDNIISGWFGSRYAITAHGLNPHFTSNVENRTGLYN